MRFWRRLRNLLTARFHNLLDRFEDPECMATQALRDLENQMNEARQQAAVAIAVERRLDRELQLQETQAHRSKEQARLALSQGNEELARWALVRGLQQQDLVKDLRTQHAAARQAGSEIKENLQAMHVRFENAQRRHLVLLATQQSAKVRYAAQQTIGSENSQAKGLAANLARWENRLAESADFLLALVEANSPQQDQEAELAALETHQRVERELEKLQQECATELTPIINDSSY